MTASGSIDDVGLDPGRGRVDDGDTGLQVRGNDLVAKPRAGGSEIGPGVHAFANTGVLRTVHGYDAPVIHQVSNGVGEVELALGVVGVEPGEGAPEGGRVDDVDRRVDLADGQLLGRRVARLDDRDQPAVVASEDAAVRARVVGLEGEDRRRRSFGPVRLEQAGEGRGGEEWRIAGEDEDVPLEALERRLRGGGGVTGAARLLLDGEHGSRRQRALELGHRPGRGHDDERVGVELARRRDDPVHEAAAEQLVQVLRPRRTHARAETGGHHHRCDGGASHEGVMAGAGGFEPPVTGPKPVALPLGYAPLKASIRPPTGGP